MPTGAVSPADPLHYIGFGKQSVKGTGVAPTKFFPYLPGLDFAHNVQSREVREGGSGLFADRVLKDTVLPGASASAALRPDLAAAMFAWCLGSSPAPAGGGPYVHTITPSTAMTWLSVERNINDELTERIVDSAVTSLTLDIQKRDSGSEPIMTVETTGLDSIKQGSQTAIVLESNERPFERADADGEWIIDGVVADGATAGAVERATLTLDWVLDDRMLADALARNDLMKLRLAATIEVVQLFHTTADLNAYLNTHYGSTVSTVYQAQVYEGDFETEFTHSQGGAGGNEVRRFKVTCPRVAWSDARLTEPDPEPNEAIRLTRTGAILNDAGGPDITVEVENQTSTAYV